MPQDPVKVMLKRLLIAVVFSIAFGYIESAVVVYLRAIFYPDGFGFPLEAFAGLSAEWRRLLLTEVGREAATLALIFTAAWLFGKTFQERFAYFMVIFAVWDIFYYVWLKVLLDWPASIMEWDILFLIPVAWASPVLCPVVVSLLMLVFAAAILYRCARGRPLRTRATDWIGLGLGGVIIVVSFCIGGMHMTEADYASYFSWPLFAVGFVIATAACLRCVLRPGCAQQVSD